MPNLERTITPQFLHAPDAGHEGGLTETLLRPAKPETIAATIKEQWDTDVHIQWPEAGQQQVVVPEGWHGAGKKFDAFVHFDDGILTSTISGKYISNESLVTWAKETNFAIKGNNHSLSVDEAVSLLDSNQSSTDHHPLVELVRSKENGTPISIQIFSTMRSPEMFALSQMGNGKIESDPKRYADIMKTMFEQFVPFDINPTKRTLGIGDSTKREGFVDDLFASLATTKAVEEMKRQLGVWQEDSFLHMQGVGITQLAAVVAIAHAELRNTPLILQTSVLGGGLSGNPETLNYIFHTDPDLIKSCGSYCFGDVGNFTAFAGIEDLIPRIIHLYGGSNTDVETYCLRGGEPVRRSLINILHEYKMQRGKTQHLISAGRANEGLEHYAVGIKGLRAVGWM